MHPAFALRKAECGAFVAIEQGAGLNADLRHAVVGTVLQIAKKPLDERHWNEVAHVVELEVGLKRDADHLAVLHHRTPAVARIDCRVGLDEQVRVHARMDVGAELDARDHALGVRQLLPAKRVAIGLHPALQLWEFSEGQWHQPLIKRRIAHLKQGEVRVMRNGCDLGDERFGHRGFVDEQHPGVADHVRAREDQSRLHQKARSRVGLRGLHAPRSRPVRTLLVVSEPHHRLLHHLHLTRGGVEQCGGNNEKSEDEG